VHHLGDAYKQQQAVALLKNSKQLHSVFFLLNKLRNPIIGQPIQLAQNCQRERNLKIAATQAKKRN